MTDNFLCLLCANYVNEYARQLSANDDVIFMYAIFHSNDIRRTYFYHSNSIKMQNSQPLNLRTG